MKDFAGFEFRGLTNLGDNIQSIATERLLPEIRKRFNRDTLANATPLYPMNIVMNGWFSHQPASCLPLKNSLHPIFWGFHITDLNNSWNYFSRKDIVEYLKKYEPIGCRDPYTAERLSDLGLKTFVSYCLTLTFPTRKQAPVNGRIIAVDINPSFLPQEIKEQTSFYTHIVPGSKYREGIKRACARYLLSLYKTKAKLVITTRLHCLLPCIALGVPVIFLGNPTDYRISWVREIGVEIYTYDKQNEINWNPNPIPFEEEKRKMTNKFIYYYKHNSISGLNMNIK